MALIPGSSEESIHSNIKKLIGEGYKRKQAVAIALSTAGKAKIIHFPQLLRSLSQLKGAFAEQ